ncbi:hypothetical protein ACLB2K_029443 [Fragaria x ananassa]
MNVHALLLYQKQLGTAQRFSYGLAASLSFSLSHSLSLSQVKNIELELSTFKELYKEACAKRLKRGEESKAPSKSTKEGQGSKGKGKAKQESFA